MSQPRDIPQRNRKPSYFPDQGYTSVSPQMSASMGSPKAGYPKRASTHTRKNSDDYKRYSGTVNHYGRHSNDWLFGGFSVRETFRDSLDRLRGQDKESWMNAPAQQSQIRPNIWNLLSELLCLDHPRVHIRSHDDAYSDRSARINTWSAMIWKLFCFKVLEPSVVRPIGVWLYSVVNHRVRYLRISESSVIMLRFCHEPLLSIRVAVRYLNYTSYSWCSPGSWNFDHSHRVLNCVIDRFAIDSVVKWTDSAAFFFIETLSNEIYISWSVEFYRTEVT